MLDDESSSIPDELKKRMDRVKEPVNWSSLAADAFELKLGEIARRQEEKTLEEVIARLRAHIVEDEMDDSARGHRVGSGRSTQPNPESFDASSASTAWICWSAANDPVGPRN